MRFTGIKSLVVGAIMVLSPTAIYAQDTVTLLDRGEPYAAMAANGGVLYVGQSRRDFNSDYRLQAFRQDGTMIGELTLSHSLYDIKPVATGGVMITGINNNTRLTEYTQARVVQGRLTKTTTGIDLGGFITFWVGQLNNRHYFVDVGGNPNDDTDDFSLPAQTIFSATRSAPRYLASRVRMPVAGQVDGDKLVLVSSNGIGASGGKIVEVNPVNGAIRELAVSSTAGYSDLWIIPGQNLMVTNARLENELRILNRTTGATVRAFPTRGYTRSVAAYGHCVVAGSDEENVVEFFDRRDGSNDAAVVTAQVKLPSTEFSGIKKIAIDQATGTVFARANFACNPLVTQCVDDYNRVVRFGDDVTAAIRAACL